MSSPVSKGNDILAMQRSCTSSDHLEDKCGKYSSRSSGVMYHNPQSNNVQQCVNQRQNSLTEVEREREFKQRSRSISPIRISQDIDVEEIRKSANQNLYKQELKDSLLDDSSNNVGVESNFEQILGAPHSHHVPLPHSNNKPSTNSKILLKNQHHLQKYAHARSKNQDPNPPNLTNQHMMKVNHDNYYPRTNDKIKVLEEYVIAN